MKTACTLEIGQIRIHQTTKWCDSCFESYRSGKPGKIVPHLCKFGFDILVYVGMASFVEHQNEKQIQEQLGERNVAISIRQVGHLAKKFIVYLSLAHRESQERIKDLLLSRGGYILHIDATCDGDSPHLMTALDETAKIVLSNIKMPSEKSEKIIPFLTDVKQSYGMPIAMVHDMGSGILSSVKDVFPDIPDYVCHYHFLRDIGKDLLGDEYAKIGNGIVKHSIRPYLRRTVRTLRDKISTEPNLAESLSSYLKDEGRSVQVLPPVRTYILTNWILDANSELNGYGFPFDRAHHVFFKRLLAAKDAISDLPIEDKEDRYVSRLNRVIGRIAGDKNLREAVNSMEEKAQVFDQLRDAMRIASPDGQKGLNDDGEDADIQTIREAVTAFRNSDGIVNAAGNNLHYRKMVKQIDKYWEKLFADPIAVTTQDGKRLWVQPQRTNNILERFFRDIKRMYRSKSSAKSLNRAIKSMIADTPLVKNLSNPEYMEALLDGKETLEARFSEIDAKLVRDELKKKEPDQVRMPPRMRKVFREHVFPFALARRPKLKAAI